MDLMGLLPETRQGNHHVLVVADSFTNWVEAFPVPNMEAETVDELVAREVICWFGKPQALNSDQGCMFEGKVMKELARVTRTKPYHPQADGQVERFNRTLAAMLSSVVAPIRKTGMSTYLFSQRPIEQHLTLKQGTTRTS